MPEQWLANTTAPGVAADDRRRLDFVIYGAAARGESLCCDPTLVSTVRRNGSPIAGTPERDGVALLSAQRRKLARYPELARRSASPVRSGCRDLGALERRLCNAWSPEPLPRCEEVGHDAGGAFWRWQPSAPHAVRCAAFGPCRHCPMLT